jgi:hypothetical protein
VDPAAAAAARRAVLDAIPPAPGDQGTSSAQAVPALPPVRPSAPPRTARPAPSLAPVTLAPSPLAIGSHAAADPVPFALHPSRFADPGTVANRIGLAAVTLAGDPAPATQAAGPGGQNPPAPQASGRTPQAASLSPYERACQLEKDRQFVMAMCRDLQGRIWVGCEAGAPGDGVAGGVQCWDPSKPPLESFTAYSTKDGLGDDNGYAVACDLQGRIWVGHLNHGVSVFNGQKWQNYEVVGGLSRPDTLSGPLGERIFHITVCPKLEVEATFKDPLTGKESPMSGSAWMCTSAGLSVYFPSTDTWSYVTRADGLPSDQANSLAFDRQGRLYLATQCDGLAIADPADRYQKWAQVKGPEELPTAPAGDGLPTNLLNDVLVAGDGTVYVATTAGVAWSGDRGGSWKFMRGADWADKVLGRADGPPAGWVKAGGATLAEDYCAALAEDGERQVWVGHRRAGVMALPASTSPVQGIAGKVTAFVAGPKGAGVVGTYGGGVTAASAVAVPRVAAESRPGFPAGAGVDHATALLAKPAAPGRAGDAPSIALLAEDWQTQGDWVGRYGRQYGILCAAHSPFDQKFNRDRRLEFSARIGPHAKAGDGIRRWLHELRTDVPNSLWNGNVGTRTEAEYDDHGEAYPAAWEGPDLWVDLKLAEGTHRVSLYFFDPNAHPHALNQNARDYLLLAGRPAAGAATGFAGEPSARVRVTQFDGGVYKQFLVSGGETVRFAVLRQGSLNTILNGIFVDRLTGPTTLEDTWPTSRMGDVHVDPPAAGDPRPAEAALRSRWERLAAEVDGPGAAALHQRRDRVLLYRLAGADPAAGMLGNWRWTLPLWTPADRQAWAELMGAGWKDFLRVNPQLAKTPAVSGGLVRKK